MSQLGERIDGWRRLPLVGVIILNWNRPEYTFACLSTLVQLDYPAVEIVVVDNASDRGSLAEVRVRFPNVHVLENTRNLGVAAGNNVGITYLLGRGVEYILLLNDDAEVAPDLLRCLVDVGERVPEIGILGPTIYYYEPGDTIWFAGGTVDKHGSSRNVLADQCVGERPLTVQNVDYVTGCALLIKREVIEAVGNLDERFFAYYEETEWCARARRAGFRVVYVPPARVWHKITPTERAASPIYLYLMARNRLLYLQCGGASHWIISRACFNLLRTAASWALRSRHQSMRPYAGLLLEAVGAFLIQRFGAPPERLLIRS